MRRFLCLLFFSLPLFGFSNQADSILHATEHITPDTARARAILDWVRSNGKQDYELKSKLSGLVISLTPPNSSLHGYAQVEKANAEYFLGRYENALGAYLKALDAFESSGDKEGSGHAHHHLGVYKKKLRKFKEAEEHFLKANEFFEAAGKTAFLSSGYNGIGAIWEEQGDLKKAISYYEKAVALNLKYADSVGLSYSYDYLSGCYGNLGEYAKAIRYLEDALRIRLSMNDDFAVSINLNNLGETYYLMKDLNKAEDFFLRSLQYSEKIRFADLMAHTYEKLSEVYADRKQFDKALDYHRKLKSVKDSILNERSTRQIAEMETKYETEKKEKENLKLKEVNTEQELSLSRSRNWIFGLTSGSLLIILVGSLYYVRYKSKQKALFDEAMLKEQVAKTRAIVEAEEKERLRIAQELHDGVGQTLSALKLNLSSFEGKTVKAEDLTKLITLSDDSVKEVRSISHMMVPGALRKSGLEAAVREFLSKLPKSDMTIDFECHETNLITDNTLQAILYRVIQEAMTNILKHAQATRVHIQLVRHPEEISLIIEDNGKGFDPQQVPEDGGIGLRNIVTRVESLNGNVNFDSSPGKGTTLNVEIPL